MDELSKIDQLYRSDQLEKAEELIHTTLQTYPENADLHFWLGKIYYRKQEWGKAINQFQQVLEIDPSYPGAKEQIQMANSILGYFTPDMFNP
ncbi:MAG: tetratricopeptide repeat protein [Mangrovibacterium sp.]|jgi:TolA-binding protein